MLTVIAGVVYEPGMDLVDRATGLLSGPSRMEVIQEVRGDTIAPDTGDPVKGPTNLQVWNQTLANTQALAALEARMDKAGLLGAKMDTPVREP